MIAVIAFLSLIFIHHTYAISGRVLQGCTSVGNHIYCYGGYFNAQGGVFTNFTSEHITTDITKIASTTAAPTPIWTTIPPPSTNTGPALEARAALSIAALDDTRYMILGGGHFNPLNTPGEIFDSKSQTWTALPEPPFYMSEGEMVASDANTVWAYGGKLNSSGSYTPSNFLKMDLSTAPGTWTVVPAGQGSPTTSRYGHAMVVRNGMIYFFGGFLDLPEVNLQPNIIPLFNVTFYNTATDQWGMIQATGDQISPRKDHTATLIEGTNKVLIYGGTGIANLQALPLNDFCYIYDLDEHTYTKINMTTNGAGGRIGHSAIAYQKSVFILFGYDGSGNILSDTHVLDVSNPSAPVWAGTQTTNPTTPPPHNSSSPEPQLLSPGISSGAIAGIVVGVVAAIAIAGAVAFMFYRKKRNQTNNAFDYYIPPPQDFNVDVNPTMFPENNDKYHNQQQQSENPNDPVPTYPITKPHERGPESVMMEPMPKIKPAAED